MSKSDGRTLWRLIDRAEKREAARFEREVTASGVSAMEFVSHAFYDWTLAAKPEDVGLAILQIARQGTQDQKLLKAAKIADVWE
jgi:hypothetical protein